MKHIYNPSGAEVTVEVDFDEKRTTESTTTWEHSFGGSVTWSAGVNIEIFSASTEVTLSYDYKMGTTSSVTVEKSFTRKYVVTVPPQTSVQVNLMAKKTNNLSVPFVATLKRVINGRTTTVKKGGTWKGILYSDDTITVKEVSLRK